MTTADNQNPRVVRNILFLLFALPVLSFASWVSRTPDVLHEKVHVLSYWVPLS
ncbi:hypothetical protein J40TS1_53120 [Paenibacillus montaniterrae]|uniref:Uncharacterized protein n=1 Tax=Paenibacillus montaniterrae TaxID=429341 RepID=A0A920D0K6_9BACL|nr:hypothetical protein J40TS1_53120 [Paenibacillus montaniterrae]